VQQQQLMRKADSPCPATRAPQKKAKTDGQDAE
jgi:hypothetical protein